MLTPLLETGARIGTIKPHAGMGLERTRNRFTAFLDDMAPYPTSIWLKSNLLEIPVVFGNCAG